MITIVNNPINDLVEVVNKKYKKELENANIIIIYSSHDNTEPCNPMVSKEDEQEIRIIIDEERFTTIEILMDLTKTLATIILDFGLHEKENEEIAQKIYDEILRYYLSYNINNYKDFFEYTKEAIDSCKHLWE